MANYLYIDTEFSSFDSKRGDLLQLAIQPVIDGTIIEPFNEFVAPRNLLAWNKKAEEVHGISEKRAMGFQSYGSLQDRLLSYMEQFDCYFVVKAFSCNTDKRYIEKLTRESKNGLMMAWNRRVKHNWDDVLNKVKDRKKSVKSINNKLGGLCEYFQIEINAHDALSDAIATMKLDEILSTLPSDKTPVSQLSMRSLSEIEKREKYIDSRYVQIGGNGTVYITEHATSDKEAMRIIFDELWQLYIDS